MKGVRFSVNMKEQRIKNLRNMKIRGSKIPNMKSKLWAIRLQDELSKNEVIQLPGESANVSQLTEKTPPLTD